ncbi:MAG: phenylalanine--tRNA ligase subunit beta [Infirmifilum sp.]|uniref:phenylalanine--tRNA ligase subunit beta n=1 Tax=Infirmifilum TaxID=2856573 RepID=UPI003C7797C2
MPVVEVKLWDLERLVGVSLSESELRNILPRLKCEVEDIAGDTISFEATHDRPDLYSAELLSIYVKGLLGLEKGLPKVSISDHTYEAHINGPSYRPYAYFAVVKGVSLDDESIRQLMQLQEKIHLTYGRDRRKVSIGLYDLTGVEFPVKYSSVKPDAVKFKPLGFTIEMTPREVLKTHPKGIAYRHLLEGQEEVPLIVDARNQVVSFPPITNSEDYRLTENSKDILIDVTSTDPEAGKRIITLVAYAVAMRGGTIHAVRNIYREDLRTTPITEPERIVYDTALNQMLLGLDIDIENTVELLARMRMKASPLSPTTLSVEYPYFRVDILHPVDIAEEVAMAYGFDTIEPSYMPPLHPGREDGLEVFSRAVREGMIGMGFVEVNNYIMTSKALMFDRMNLPAGDIIEVENPKHETFHALRVWISPQLLATLSASKHAGYPQRIFEVGDVVIPDPMRENKARDERHLAFAIAGRGVTLTDGMAVLKTLASQFGVEVTYQPLEHPSLIQGRSAKIYSKLGELGIIGEVHPAVLQNFELKVPVVICELDLSHLKRCFEECRKAS